MSAAAPVYIEAKPKFGKAFFGATDSWRSHPSRLQTVNANLCVGRKLDEGHPVEGTRKEDPGSNGVCYPEKQCPKKPLEDGRLCAACKSKEEQLMTEGKWPKRWHGRLDFPLSWRGNATAWVVGSTWFWRKYPGGVNDIKPNRFDMEDDLLVTKGERDALCIERDAALRERDASRADLEIARANNETLQSDRDLLRVRLNLNSELRRNEEKLAQLSQAMTSAPALADEHTRIKRALETRNAEIRTQVAAYEAADV